MKTINTVTVIEISNADAAITDMASFPETDEGNAAAAALFRCLYKQLMPDATEIEAALEDGWAENSGKKIIIIHSTEFDVDAVLKEFDAPESLKTPSKDLGSN